MRLLVAAAAVFLALAPAARAQGVVACPAFKSAWQASLKRLSLVAAGPTYGRIAGQDAERVTGIAGIEGSIACREGALAHLELAASGDPAALAKASASVLMALDKTLSSDAAGATTAALKAESEGMKKDAVSTWGPYEMTWTAAAPPKSSQFILDLAEN